MSTALILGEIAKMSLQAYFLACEQRKMSKEEALKEIAVEYEGFKQRDPDLIPDVLEEETWFCAECKTEGNTGEQCKNCFMPRR